MTTNSDINQPPPSHAPAPENDNVTSYGTTYRTARAGHQRQKEIPGHSQRHIQERPSTQKDLQQEHLEAQLFVYDKPRQQHQHPQQISHQ